MISAHKPLNEIRVANIIEDGRIAGPQIRIAEVAKRMNQGGNSHGKKQEYKSCKITTIVIFPYKDGKEFKKCLEKNGVSFIQLPLQRLTKVKTFLLKYLLFFAYEIWLLYRVFRKYKFDIVHVSGGSWQYKGLIAGHLAGCKVLWHFNDTKMPGVFRAFSRIFADIFADGFIVSGKKVRKYYLGGLKIPKEKPVFEIQSPVDCSFFKPRGNGFDQKIISYNGVSIISVGNINPLKGFEYFLYMAKELNIKYSFLNYWVVGPCFKSQKKYFGKIEKIKNELELDRFFFYGNCKDVRSVLESADIYLCCSITEASPLSVWEAMAMGKPVVATDVGDIANFVKDGYNGFIVPVSDFKAMAEKIAILIDDSNLRKIFGTRARETALRYLDVKRAEQEHYKAYTQIL
jgi:glycosyltransferase involved in cell wall biosynthesis